MRSTRLTAKDTLMVESITLDAVHVPTTVKSHIKDWPRLLGEGVNSNRYLLICVPCSHVIILVLIIRLDIVAKRKSTDTLIGNSSDSVSYNPVSIQDVTLHTSPSNDLAVSQSALSDQLTALEHQYNKTRRRLSVLASRRDRVSRQHELLESFAESFLSTTGSHTKPARGNIQCHAKVETGNKKESVCKGGLRLPCRSRSLSRKIKKSDSADEQQQRRQVGRSDLYDGRFDRFNPMAAPFWPEGGAFSGLGGGEVVQLNRQIDAMRNFFTLYNTQAPRLEQELVMLANQSEQCGSELESLARKLSQLEWRRNQMISRELHIVVASKDQDVQDSTVQIDLTYSIGSASWQPAYDLRLSNSSDSIQLTYYGIVRQSTGEEWVTNRLTLSTGQPHSGAQLPELSAERLEVNYLDSTEQSVSARPRPRIDMETRARRTRSLHLDDLTSSIMASGQDQFLPTIDELDLDHLNLMTPSSPPSSFSSPPRASSGYDDLQNLYNDQSWWSQVTDNGMSEQGTNSFDFYKNINPPTMIRHRQLKQTDQTNNTVDDSLNEILAKISAPTITKRATNRFPWKSECFTPRSSFSQELNPTQYGSSAIPGAFIDETNPPATSFRLDRTAEKVVLQGNGDPTRVLLSSIDFRPHLEYITIPRLTPKAFLRARMHNTSEVTLLQGQANIYVDDNFIGKITLPTTAIREEFACDLGVDAGIQIQYKPRHKYVKASNGIVGSSSSNGTLSRVQQLTAGATNVIVYRQLIVLTNTYQRIVRLLLIDQLPVSSNERLKIQLIEPVIKHPDRYDPSKPIRMTKAKRIEWDLTLDPSRCPCNFG